MPCFVRLIIAGLLLAAPLAAQWKAAESTTTCSYRRAREVLLASAQAHGGLETLRALKTQYRSGRGKAYSQGQNLSPDSPPIVRDFQAEAWLDYAGNRVRVETRTSIAGLPVHTRNVAAGDAGYLWNAATGAAFRATAGQIAAMRNNLRRDPLRLIANALARPESLRLLSSDTDGFEGRPHEVVGFTEPEGTLLTLYFDARTHLLSKLETWADSPVFGDTLTEQIYSDYRSVGGVKVPFRFVVRNAGEIVQELAYSEVRINTPLEPAMFDVPRDLLDQPSAPMQVASFAPGLHFIGGGTHNSLAVVFRDHVIVVEGPLSSDRSRAVLDKVRELAPGKPVRYVVNTHYHYDHSGGLREYIAEGVAVVTHEVNAGFIRRMAAGPGRTLRRDRLSLKPAEPGIETVTDKRVFSDGEQTLELYLVPNSHVNGMLVAYLPTQKVLFNSDLFSIPAVGPLSPANDFAVELREAIRKLGLKVETLAGGHGRVGTFAELEKAMALRK